MTFIFKIIVYELVL